MAQQKQPSGPHGDAALPAQDSPASTTGPPYISPGRMPRPAGTADGSSPASRRQAPQRRARAEGRTQGRGRRSPKPAVARVGPTGAGRRARSRPASAPRGSGTRSRATSTEAAASVTVRRGSRTRNPARIVDRGDETSPPAQPGARRRPSPLPGPAARRGRGSGDPRAQPRAHPDDRRVVEPRIDAPDHKADGEDPHNREDRARPARGPA